MSENDRQSYTVLESTSISILQVPQVLPGSALKSWHLTNGVHTHLSSTIFSQLDVLDRQVMLLGQIHQLVVKTQPQSGYEANQTLVKLKNQTLAMVWLTTYHCLVRFNHVVNQTLVRKVDQNLYRTSVHFRTDFGLSTTRSLVERHSTRVWLSAWLRPKPDFSLT